MATYDPDDIVEDCGNAPSRLAAGASPLLSCSALERWSVRVGPGLHFKFPDGIERVQLVPRARVLKEEFGFVTATPGAYARTQYMADKKASKDVSLMLTGDLNVIDVQWIGQYRIEDPVGRFEKRRPIWDGDPNQIPTKGREFIWIDTPPRWRIADARSSSRALPRGPARDHA